MARVLFKRIHHRALKTAFQKALHDARNEIVGQVRQRHKDGVKFGVTFDKLANGVLATLTVFHLRDRAADFDVTQFVGVDAVGVEDVAAQIGDGDELQGFFLRDDMRGGFTQATGA